MVAIDMDVIDDNDEFVPCYAERVKRPWPGGGSTEVVQIYIGSDTIRLWPVNVSQMESLARDLTEIAKQIRTEE